jgi:hypothetical protein
MSPADEYQHTPQPRVFAGFRPRPPDEYVTKGLTNQGNGPDYEGVIFTDGTVVIRWKTEWRSHSVWPDWDSFWHVHGHAEYDTVIAFADCLPAPASGHARGDG